MLTPDPVSSPAAAPSPRIAGARLLIGVLQGLLLAALYYAARDALWPATETMLFAPLLLVATLLPPLLISSLGSLPRRPLLRWMAVVAPVLAALAVYDSWRTPTGHSMLGDQQYLAVFPSALLFCFATVGLFIGHALVLAAQADGRRFASYASYFELSWKFLVQLLFSGFFVGVAWLVLWLGSALFALVHLNFLRELLQKAWFAIPVTAFAYSCAMHLTDVRPAIVRGIRGLLLVLLSWILPLAALMVAGFLMSMFVTGLAPLWATRSATSVLLLTAAMLVILVNAGFQNGAVADSVARVIKLSARIAALCLLPLVGIATYALALRVGEYGWTTDRVIAAACLLVAAVYALGYAWAALRNAGWLDRIAGVNVLNAFVVLGVLLLLFSPLADPARLAVNSQMARLADGRVTADKFDFDFLQQHGARYGRQALAELSARATGADAARVREAAGLAQKRGTQTGRNAPPSGAAELTANLTTWPPGTALPPSLLQQDWSKYKSLWQLPGCLRERGHSCDVFAVNFSGEARQELLLVDLVSKSALVLAEDEQKTWRLIGQLPHVIASCPSVLQALRAGQFHMLAAQHKDLEVNGQRYQLLPREQQPLRCEDGQPGSAGAASTAASAAVGNSLK